MKTSEAGLKVDLHTVLSAAGRSPEIPEADASLKAWRITWINPVAGHQVQQIGRRSGRDIVQLGALPDGTLTRWMFTEIKPDSFHWTGETLGPDGQTWNPSGEFLAKRTR
jgi:hypothetical protein